MLSVNDHRSRNRSRSPGGGRRERSNSRSVRAPSPAARAPSPMRTSSPSRNSSRKQKKYYEPDSDEDAGSAPSDVSDRKSSRRSRAGRGDSDRYERSEKKKRGEHVEPEYKSIRPKGARDESPEERGEYLRDGAEVPLKPLSSETMKYIQAPPEKDHNVHYHDTRHYSYAGPPSHVAGNGQWEYVQPAELSRHMSYSRPEQLQDHGVASQSSYQREYEEEMERKRQERARQEQGGWGQEQARGMSFETPGAFPSDDRSANAAQNPMSPSAMQHPPGEYPQMTRQENYQPQTHQANYHPQTHQAEYHPQDSTRQTEYRQPSHGFYQPHSPDETSQPIIMSVAGSRPQYYVPQKFQYAEAPKEIKYVSKPQTEKSQYRMPPQAQIEVGRKRTGHAEPEHRVEYRGEQRGERIEERRGDRGEHRKDHQGHREHREEYRAEKTSSRGHRGETKYIEIHPRDSTLNAPPSPGLAPRVQRLSISGGRSGGQSGALTLSAPDIHHNPSGTGALPPGSPLQEAYQGTWQSISPMPSPMALPSALDDGLSDLEPLSPEFDTDDSQHRRPRKSILKKRVSIYDPEPDARAIAAELKHAKPGAEALIHILPQLSDDNMLALRTEYKKHFKVGGKGINVAKHVKTKLPGNIGKVAYATALGRWESEAYWANCWYQSGSSRRELLIESLMGRPNREVRAIKEAFRDKRYGDSLERCMQTELKRDKFRMAILLALDERRGDEMAPVSKTRVREDVQDLYRALVAKEGGETAMIEIVVVRSDNHLREVLKEFEARYRRNFAREMIQKSQNLVGETLAHILNGVLNRPVRDALLLHQALAETSKDRAELLMSRLIRFHWEPKHLDRVKAEYQKRYRHRLERDVEEGTKGEFGDFCVALCEGAR